MKAGRKLTKLEKSQISTNIIRAQVNVQIKRKIFRYYENMNLETLQVFTEECFQSFTCIFTCTAQSVRSDFTKTEISKLKLNTSSPSDRGYGYFNDDDDQPNRDTIF